MMLTLPRVTNVTRFGATKPDPGYTVSNVYKIKRGDGQYSKGGKFAQSAEYKWHPTKGKAWGNAGQLKNHLHQYGAKIPSDWVVEEYQEVKFTRKVGDIPAQAFFAETLAKKTADMQRRQNEMLASRIADLKRELARLESLNP
jgi:hypothetical protein